MKELSVYPIIYEQNIAWGDMDAFGHVNNVHYYRYMESARIRYLSGLNIFDQGILTVVAAETSKKINIPDMVRNKMIQLEATVNHHLE